MRPQIRLCVACRFVRPPPHELAYTVYRALAEAEDAAADDGLPIRPEPVRIRHPDDPLTPEETDLRECLQAQVLQRPADQ